MVERVRRFNRTVTQRVGALDEAFLARGRSLGQCRLLWEIGADGRDGTDVRLLRTRLGLDSGYVSRMLRAPRRRNWSLSRRATPTGGSASPASPTRAAPSTRS